MMRRALLALGVLIVMVIAGVAALLLTLDVNQYKPQIESAVQRATQREFAITGAIELKPSLIPTLLIRGVTLGNVAGSRNPFVTIKRFEARVRLKPSLSRRLEISRVEIDGAHVLLETDKDGRRSWDFGVAQPAEPERPLSFDVSAVEITDAVIDYRAFGRAPITLTVARLALSSSDATAPMSLDLMTHINKHEVTARGTLAPLTSWTGNATCHLDLTLASGALEFTIAGDIATPLAAPMAKLTFALAAPSGAEIASLLGTTLPVLAPVRMTGVITAASDRVIVDDLAFAIARSDARGRVGVVYEDGRPRVEVKLNADLIDLSPFDPPPRAKARRRDRLFSSAPLPLAGLAAFDADVQLTADALKSHGLTLSGIKIGASLKRGTLIVNPITATVEGGAVQGTLAFENTDSDPHLNTKFNVRNVGLARWFDGTSGIAAPAGKMDSTFAVDGRGKSIAAIMGSANGHVTIDARNLELTNHVAAVASGDLVMQTFSLLNPLSRHTDTTTIECAVMNFPITHGRLEHKTGIGMTTRQLHILGGGNIDLKSERIDLAVDPKPRAGLGLNVASIAGVVRIGGTLSAPAPVADARGAATVGAKVGAAIATGGLSLLAEGLLDRTEGDVDVCAVARGDQALPTSNTKQIASSPSAASKATDAAGSVVKGAGRALKGAGNAVEGVFKSLFGH